MTQKETMELVTMNFSFFQQTVNAQQIEITQKIWYSLFKEYDKKVVQEAFMKAISYSKYLLKPADLWPFIPKATTIQAEWQALKAKIPEIERYLYYRHTPLIKGVDAEGNAIKTDGTKELQEIYDNLSSTTKDYLGSVGGLIEFSHKQGDDLETFEFNKFSKHFNSLEVQHENRQEAQRQNNVQIGANNNELLINRV